MTTRSKIFSQSTITAYQYGIIRDYKNLEKLSGNLEIWSQDWATFYFKRNAQFIFLCNPTKYSVNVCLMKILKSTVTKKVILCFNNLGEENAAKVAVFVIFPISIMVLFEIHQRSKGHFLNELRVSFKCKNSDVRNMIFHA